MGAKSSHFFQADRPESGGANKDGIKDKTGQHEQDKQRYAATRKHDEEAATGLQNGVESPRNAVAPEAREEE